jgi:hypothetical protein
MGAMGAKYARVGRSSSLAELAQPLDPLAKSIAEVLVQDARQVTGTYYNGMENFKEGMEAEGLVHNMGEIHKAMAEGRTIIDIGPDYARRATGRISPNYMMEQSLTRGYPGLQKSYVPAGQTSMSAGH